MAKKEPKQQGLTFCRPAMKGTGPAKRTSPKWCVCGCKARGKNHKEGQQHKAYERKVGK